MARPGLTYTEVEAAAKQLQAESKLPTVDGIRNLIKSGSDTTIARHLNSWKDRHSLEAQAGNIPLPLFSAVQGLWNSLKEEASTRISIHEAEATAKIEAIEKVIRRFEEQHKADQHEKNVLETSLLEFKHQSTDLTALLQTEKTENARLFEQINGYKRQCTQQSTELANVHELLRHTQTNLEHFQTTNMIQKEAHSLERENERNAYLQATHALESELNRATQEKAVSDTILKHTEEALALSNQMIPQLQGNFKTLEHTVSDCKIQNALLEQRNQTLVIQLSTLEKQCETLSSTLTASLDQVNIFGHKNAELETAIHKLEDKIQILSDEKLFLIQEKSELLGQIKMLNQQKI